MLLVGVGLIIASEAITSARADNDRDRVTLYTAPLRGDTFNCNAVNVSDKTLQIAFAVLDDFGKPLPCSGSACTSPPPANPEHAVVVHPGEAQTIGSIYLSSPGEGYCVVDVSGTGDRDDVRVVLNINLTRTIPGTNPPVPIFVVRSIEGH
jgi:hypothetical protein